MTKIIRTICNHCKKDISLIGDGWIRNNSLAKVVTMYPSQEEGGYIETEYHYHWDCLKEIEPIIKGDVKS